MSFFFLFECVSTLYIQISCRLLTFFKTVSRKLYSLKMLLYSRLEKTDVTHNVKEDVKLMKEGFAEMQRRLFEMKGELPVQDNG